MPFLLCNALHHTVPHCNTLHHTAPHCNTLQQTAPHCNTLQHTVTHVNTRKHTATHCNTLQHTETHCNTKQHTATHRNTLQHTATHCWHHVYMPCAAGFYMLMCPCVTPLFIKPYIYMWKGTSAYQGHKERHIYMMLAVCCSVLQCVVVCYSVLQRVAVCLHLRVEATRKGRDSQGCQGK